MWYWYIRFHGVVISIRGGEGHCGEERVDERKERSNTSMEGQRVSVGRLVARTRALRRLPICPVMNLAYHHVVLSAHKSRSLRQGMTTHSLPGVLYCTKYSTWNVRRKVRTLRCCRDVLAWSQSIDGVMSYGTTWSTCNGR